ncbi:hypothetical protein J2X63_001483 [Agromyces sp. 3263]|uniref:hypothetical protein n=1 Tax=Agromyces sp. 3263 TaxID=2817750 RepID=UPI00285F553A|nr:hypothetical protein [Agromyces sp. 3263]MDR6905797.1 hypothetical protein [Agromyces sp. 3263]
MSAVDAAELLRREPVCGMTWGWVGTRGTWATPGCRSRPWVRGLMLWDWPAEARP